MSAQHFTAPYDRTTKILSVALTTLLLIVVPTATRSKIATAVCVLGLIALYAFSPRSYTIDGRMLLVHRLIGAKRIPLTGIRELRAANAADLSGAIRLFGNGGLFGYWGIFSTSKLGTSRWYVTDQNRPVVLITEAKTYVLSPGDVAGFLTAIQTAMA